MRAYSHQGHGPRAEQQAGYISATSDSTPSVAKGSRSIHSGHEDEFPRSRANGRCRFSEGTFAGTPGNGQDAPEAVIGFQSILAHKITEPSLAEKKAAKPSK